MKSKTLPMSLTVLAASVLAGVTFCLCSVNGAENQKPQTKAEAIPNAAIDYNQFMVEAGEVRELREGRRLKEDEFIKMAADKGIVVLDARSADKFALLHIKGAVSLPLTDFTEADLAKVIPTKDTPILIYCNNNFENQQIAFTRKIAPASLNIYTFNSLYNYGYKNVYELGPLLDINTTKIQFEGTLNSPELLDRIFNGQMTIGNGRQQ